VFLGGFHVARGVRRLQAGEMVDRRFDQLVVDVVFVRGGFRLVPRHLLVELFQRRARIEIVDVLGVDHRIAPEPLGERLGHYRSLPMDSRNISSSSGPQSSGSNRRTMDSGAVLTTSTDFANALKHKHPRNASRWNWGKLQAWHSRCASARVSFIVGAAGGFGPAAGLGGVAFGAIGGVGGLGAVGAAGTPVPAFSSSTFFTGGSSR